MTETMRRIIVLNPKGGCGKTTVATNLASRYAVLGYGSALYDHDPQGCSYYWLQQRGGAKPAIHGIAAYAVNGFNITRSWALRLPPGTNRVVIDTAAALDEPQIRDQIRNADTVLVPMLPSPVDIHAGTEFLRRLIKFTRHSRVAVIANRVREDSNLEKLHQFLHSQGIPLIARLTDHSSYQQAFEAGRGVHELACPNQDDTSAWDAVVDWLEAEQVGDTSASTA